MICGADNILQNILHIQFEYEEYSVEYLSVSAMGLNHVVCLRKPFERIEKVLFCWKITEKSSNLLIYDI